jgi:hypothetical protein
MARYTRKTANGFNSARFFKMADELTPITVEELQQAGREGVLEAREIISTSGTNRQWTAPFPDRNGTLRDASGAGRIDTGAMIQAIDFKIVQGNQKVGLDVGWTDPGLWQDYFEAQDEGFDAPGYRHANQFVAGMGVISHLRVYMGQQLEEARGRIIDRVLAIQ